MANVITLAEKYTNLVDRIYKYGVLTADLENDIVEWDNAGTVKIKKITVPELGDYSREDGFTKGDLRVEWETWRLTQDKGTEFSLDAMDNEETLGGTFTQAAELFIDEKVIPSVDTYRFAQLKAKGTTVDGNALNSGEDVVNAIDELEAQAIDNEIVLSGAVLYMSATAYTKLKSQAINRFGTYTDDTYNRVVNTFDEMKIVRVPQSRLGANVDFIIVDTRAVQAVGKHKTLRIFDPNTNQDKDAWKFQYRIYHDINVFDNKKTGVLVRTHA